MTAKIKKAKKFIFPGITLLASFYASIIFGLGLVVGYIGTNIFCNKLVHTGKIKRVVLDHGKYNVIFHHWIIGLFMLFFAFATQLIYTVPVFCIGYVGGIIFHDFYTDKEWHKVIYKKKGA